MWPLWSLTSCSALPPEGAARLRHGKAGSAPRLGIKPLVKGGPDA